MAGLRSVVWMGCLAWVPTMMAPGAAWADGATQAPLAPSDNAAAPQEAGWMHMSKRTMWEYGLLGGAVAGLATGVTLVTVNHARVNDYNLGVQAYDQGVDANPATLQKLADLRDSINTGERWGYIVGAVGLAAGVAAGWLYVTDDAAAPPSAGITVGLGSFAVYGRF